MNKQELKIKNTRYNLLEQVSNVLAIEVIARDEKYKIIIGFYSTVLLILDYSYASNEFYSQQLITNATSDIKHGINSIKYAYFANDSFQVLFVATASYDKRYRLYQIDRKDDLKLRLCGSNTSPNLSQIHDIYLFSSENNLMLFLACDEKLFYIFQVI